MGVEEGRSTVHRRSVGQSAIARRELPVRRAINLAAPPMHLHVLDTRRVLVTISQIQPPNTSVRLERGDQNQDSDYDIRINIHTKIMNILDESARKR